MGNGLKLQCTKESRKLNLRKNYFHIIVRLKANWFRSYFKLLGSLIDKFVLRLSIDEPFDTETNKTLLTQLFIALHCNTI